MIDSRVKDFEQSVISKQTPPESKSSDQMTVKYDDQLDQKVKGNIFEFSDPLERVEFLSLDQIDNFYKEQSNENKSFKLNKQDQQNLYCLIKNTMKDSDFSKISMYMEFTSKQITNNEILELILIEINDYLNKNTIEYTLDKESFQRILNFMENHQSILLNALKLKFMTIIDININLLTKDEEITSCQLSGQDSMPDDNFIKYIENDQEQMETICKSNKIQNINHNLNDVLINRIVSTNSEQFLKILDQSQLFKFIINVTKLNRKNVPEIDLQDFFANLDLKKLNYTNLRELLMNQNLSQFKEDEFYRCIIDQLLSHNLIEDKFILDILIYSSVSGNLQWFQSEKYSRMQEYFENIILENMKNIKIDQLNDFILMLCLTSIKNDEIWNYTLSKVIESKDESYLVNMIDKYINQLIKNVKNSNEQKNLDLIEKIFSRARLSQIRFKDDFDKETGQSKLIHSTIMNTFDMYKIKFNPVAGLNNDIDSSMSPIISESSVNISKVYFIEDLKVCLYPIGKMNKKQDGLLRGYELLKQIQLQDQEYKPILIDLDKIKYSGESLIKDQLLEVVVINE